MNNKIGLVTMCRKAGKLVMGMDMVKDACNTGKACAVFAATDFSPKSLKEIKFNCYKNGIKLYSLGMTMDDIHFGLGKRTGVIAICEGGFAKACAKGLEEIPIDENEFYSTGIQEICLEKVLSTGSAKLTDMVSEMLYHDS